MSNLYNILIVDDSRSIRALLDEIISTGIEDVSVYSVESSEKALEYIQNNSVDLILLDIHMPAMDGFEFAKVLKQENREEKIPIIFITASSNASEFVQKGFDLGAIDYIKKPFDEVLLINKIRSYVKLFKKERELQDAYKIIYTILSHMDNLICIINEDEIIQANKTFLEFFKFSTLEQLQNKHKKITDFFVLDDEEISNDISNKKLISHLLDNQSRDTKIKLYDENKKEERIFIVKISSMTTLQNASDEYIISLTDITETERLKKSYQVQAIIDPLTQIYNRQAFNDKYPKEFYSAKSSKKPLSLIMADIDHFKKINDTYGHQIGDYVLKEFCKIANKTIPNNYFFARWGGEEFVIICKDDSMRNVIHYANKLREAIAEHEFLHVGHITSSFGITILKDDDDETKLLTRLDEALYMAKENGRNKVELI